MDYRIEWTTSTIGSMHAIKPESEVMEFAQAITALGFTPTITIED